MALAHLTKITKIVPKYILKWARVEAKRFPYTFFVCCEFSAGGWMVVVDEFSTTLKSPLLHDNSAYTR